MRLPFNTFFVKYKCLCMYYICVQIKKYFLQALMQLF